MIREKLTRAFSPHVLEIVDESLKHAGHAGARPKGSQEGSTHFHIKIVSKAFETLPRIERYRMVHEVLKTEMDDQIHALSLNLRSPQEVL